MKKLLTVLFILFALISKAQNTLDNIGLTSSTSASVAYSLRLLSTSYTGPIVRIKVGTSFYDVYPDASAKNFALTSKISAAIGTYNAGVSVASANELSTIITAGTTNATVAIWYDQSGNAVHVFSSGATAKIITAGSIVTMNGKPTIYFSGTNSFLVSTTTVNYSLQTNATVNAVAQDVASTNDISGIISTGDNGGWGLCIDPTSTSTIKGYRVDAAGGYGAFSNEHSREPKIITGTIGTPASSTSSAIYINSTLKGTRVPQSITNGTTDKIYVGSRGNIVGRQFIGNISETMMFPKTLSVSEQATLESSQSGFLPIPPSVTITSSASGAFCAGTSVTFTATPSNVTSPAYQWKKNGVDISSETNATYTTTTLGNNDQISVSCASASSIVNDASLSLWLDAANTTSYSGTGSTWTDLSGNNKNVTLTSDHSFSSTDGGSIQFNGGNNSASLPLVSNQNTNLTMQCWVYLDATTKGPFFKNGINNGYVFGTGTGADSFETGNKTTMLFAGTRWIPTTTSYGYGWKFVTMTLNESGVPSLYIGNNLVAGTYTGTNAQVPTTGTYLGRNVGDDDVNWPKFNSKMGASYFYNKVLTISEITQNYNASAARFGSSSTSSITSNSVITTVSSIPSAIVTINGDACINKTTLTADTGMTSYTWYKDNIVISGETNNTYTPTTAGIYKVAISDGTCSNTSVTTTISVCGLTAEGKMIPVENSTTLVSNEGAINNGKGIDERGLILTKPMVYGTVTSSSTGRIWMDRNLGASRVATAANDTESYGDLFQWGRKADGHEKNRSYSEVYFTASTTSKLTSTQEVSNKFVNNNSPNYDWTNNWDISEPWATDLVNNIVGGLNNPCPNGFRVPTFNELEAERLGLAGLSSPLTMDAFANSFLKIPGGGYWHLSANGEFPGVLWGLWSSAASSNGVNGKVLRFYSGTLQWLDQNKGAGYCVRCIKD